MLLENLKQILNFIKSYWKIILALLYAIAVPLWFYQSNRALVQALEISDNSSKQQIQVLKNNIDTQKAAYDKLFEEYKQKLEYEEQRYNKELADIKTKQEQQQGKLSGLFRRNPTSINDELSKRYGLNAD